MHRDAEICVKCGVRKYVGSDYCQVCGSRTLPNMLNCRKCGAKLLKSMSTAQIKKKAVSTGKKTLGNVLLVLGIILIIGMIANFVDGFSSRSLYQSAESFNSGEICGILGGLCIGFGIGFRRKKR